MITRAPTRISGSARPSIRTRRLEHNLLGFAPLLGCALNVLSGCVDPLVRGGVNPIVGCLQDAECPLGFYCQAGGCQANPRSCGSAVDCVAGETCVSNPGCSGPADAGLQCPEQRICLPINAPYCQPCQTTADCQPEAFCVQLTAGTPICTQSCMPVPCPSGSTCEAIAGPDGGALLTCLPTSGACP